MESLKRYWTESMEIPEVRWIVAIAGLVICISMAYYFAKLFRDMAMGGGEEPTAFISEFQKMREQGQLNEEEYSRLKKSIPNQLPEKLTGKDDPKLK